jgi:hypothetical protein
MLVALIFWCAVPQMSTSLFRASIGLEVRHALLCAKLDTQHISAVQQLAVLTQGSVCLQARFVSGKSNETNDQ